MSVPAILGDGSQSKTHVLEVLFRANDGGRSALFAVSSSETQIFLSACYGSRGPQSIVAKLLGAVDIGSAWTNAWTTLNLDDGRIVIRPKTPAGSIAYFDGHTMQTVEQLDAADFRLVIGRNGLPVGVVDNSSVPMRPMQRQILAIQAVRLASQHPDRNNSDVYGELLDAAQDVVIAAAAALTSGLLEDAVLGEAARPNRPAEAAD